MQRWTSCVCVARVVCVAGIARRCGYCAVLRVLRVLRALRVLYVVYCIMALYTICMVMVMGACPVCVYRKEEAGNSAPCLCAHTARACGVLLGNCHTYTQVLRKIMRVIPVAGVLRVYARPNCSHMQRQLHSRHQEVVVAAALHVIETCMVHYLANNFFYSTPNPI